MKSFKEWLEIAPLPKGNDFEGLRLMTEKINVLDLYTRNHESLGFKEKPGLMIYLGKLLILIRQVTVFAWQYKAFQEHKDEYTQEQSKIIVANLYRCYCYLDRGRRYFKYDPEDHDVKLIPSLSANELGYSGASLDDFNGTNRLNISKLSRRWGENVYRVIKAMKIKSKCINPIENFLEMIYSALNEQLKTCHLERDYVELGAVPAPFKWFPTLPSDYGEERWAYVFRHASCRDEAVTSFTVGMENVPKIIKKMNQTASSEAKKENENEKSKKRTNQTASSETKKENKKRNKGRNVQKPPKGDERKRSDLVDSEEEDAMSNKKRGLSPKNDSNETSTKSPRHDLKPRESNHNIVWNRNQIIEEKELQIINLSPLHRCLSKKEGSYFLSSFVKSTGNSNVELLSSRVVKSKDVISAKLPSRHVMMIARQMIGCLLKNQQQTEFRIGLINECRNTESIKSFGYIVETKRKHDVIWAGVLVLSGEYKSNNSENGPVITAGPGSYFFTKIGKETEQPFAASKFPSSVAVFYYFRRDMLDHLSTIGNASTLKTVIDGFSKTGLKKICNHQEHQFIPKYGENFSLETNLLDSLTCSIDMFLKKFGKKELKAGDKKRIDSNMRNKSIHLGLKCADKIIKNKGGYNLVVIANTPKGLDIFYGSKGVDSACCCHLYYHHPCHPTIPSYERKNERRFILLEPVLAGNILRKGSPYEGLSYPFEFHPYGNHSVGRSAQPSSPRYIIYPDEACLHYRLHATEEEKQSVPQIECLTSLENVNSILSRSKGCEFEISQKQVDAMRKSQRLNDEHINLLIAGVHCRSAMEEIPETIVLGTQYTTELNHHTSSVLREYHFRSKVAFDISRIKAFYLIFHIKNHYYFGVVINLKFIVGYAVDTFGVLFMDSLNKHQEQKTLVEPIVKWLNRELQNSNNSHGQISMSDVSCWHMTMTPQKGTTNCGIHATYYLLRCYQNSQVIFTSENVDNHFKDISKMDCFKPINMSACRQKAAGFIERILKELVIDNVRRQPPDSSDDELPVYHPGDSEFQNEWEAQAYRIPDLSTTRRMTPRAERTQSRFCKRKRNQEHNNSPGKNAKRLKVGSQREDASESGSSDSDGDDNLPLSGLKKETSKECPGEPNTSTSTAAKRTMLPSTREAIPGKNGKSLKVGSSGEDQREDASESGSSDSDGDDNLPLLGLKKETSKECPGEPNTSTSTATKRTMLPSSKEAIKALTLIGAIEDKYEDLGKDHYPRDLVGLYKCHLRALYNLDRAAAEKALNDKILHGDATSVYQIWQDHKTSTHAGRVIWLRKEHWVALSPNHYIDESRSFRVTNYDVACMILSGLERKYDEGDRKTIKEGEKVEGKSEIIVEAKCDDWTPDEGINEKGDDAPPKGDDEDVGSGDTAPDEQGCGQGDNAPSKGDDKEEGKREGNWTQDEGGNEKGDDAPSKGDDEDGEREDSAPDEQGSGQGDDAPSKGDGEDGESGDRDGSSDDNNNNDGNGRGKGDDEEMKYYDLLKGMTVKGKGIVNCHRMSYVKKNNKKKRGKKNRKTNADQPEVQNNMLLNDFKKFQKQRLKRINATRNEKSAILEGEKQENLDTLTATGQSFDVDGNLNKILIGDFDYKNYKTVVKQLVAFWKRAGEDIDKTIMIQDSPKELSKGENALYSRMRSRMPSGKPPSPLSVPHNDMQISHSLNLFVGRLAAFLDFGPTTDLRLACFSQMTSIVICCPTQQSQMVDFLSPRYQNFVIERQTYNLTFEQFLARFKKIFMIVHAPDTSSPGNIADLCLSGGLGTFLSECDIVSFVLFSHKVTLEGLFSFDHYMEQNQFYETCGSCGEFLFSLARCCALACATEEQKLVNINPYNSEYSSTQLVQVMIESRFKARSIDDLDKMIDDLNQLERKRRNVRGLLMGTIAQVYGTPHLLQTFSSGNNNDKILGVSVNALIQNIVLFTLQRNPAEINIPTSQWRRLFNQLEFICASSFWLYWDATTKGYSVFCECCSKNIISEGNGSFTNLHEALRCVQSASVNHRLFKQLRTNLPDGVTHDDCFTPCEPDRSVHDSCVGNDQLILSSIVNEEYNDEPLFEVFWDDISQVYFNSDKAKKLINVLEKRLFDISNRCTLRDNWTAGNPEEGDLEMEDVDSPCDKSPHQILNKLLLHNVQEVMLIDWQHPSFPRELPSDFDFLCEKDDDILEGLLKDDGNKIKYFHQLGFLEFYMNSQVKERPSQFAHHYIDIPSITYPFAFECGNGCQDIWKKKGRDVKVATKQYVMKSVIVGEDLDEQLLKVVRADSCMEFSESYEVRKYEILWIADDSLIGSGDSVFAKTINYKTVESKFKHLEWTKLPKRTVQSIKNNQGDVETFKSKPYQLESLYPFQVIASKHKRPNSLRLELAQTQLNIANAFCHGTIPHGKALEKLTNACFQISGVNVHTETVMLSGEDELQPEFFRGGNDDDCGGNDDDVKETKEEQVEKEELQQLVLSGKVKYNHRLGGFVRVTESGDLIRISVSDPKEKSKEGGNEQENGGNDGDDKSTENEEEDQKDVEEKKKEAASREGGNKDRPTESPTLDNDQSVNRELLIDERKEYIAQNEDELAQKTKSAQEKKSSEGGNEQDEETNEPSDGAQGKGASVSGDGKKKLAGPEERPEIEEQNPSWPEFFEKRKLERERQNDELRKKSKEGGKKAGTKGTRTEQGTNGKGALSSTDADDLDNIPISHLARKKEANYWKTTFGKRLRYEPRRLGYENALSYPLRAKTNTQKLTEVRAKPDGCSIPGKICPPCILDSVKFSVPIELRRWNCAVGNFTNLMQTLGHYDDEVKGSFDRVRDDVTDPFKKVQMAVLALGYRIFNLPKNLDYNALTDVVKNYQLPILVSLRLSFSGAEYHGHVIGICPHIGSKDSTVQYRIVDGGHPQLRSIEYSLDNLNWCCGEGGSFTVATVGFAFVPGKKRNMKILQQLKQKYTDEDGVGKSGLSICLGIYKYGVKYNPYLIPDHFQKFNVAREEKWYNWVCKLTRLQCPNKGLKKHI